MENLIKVTGEERERLTNISFSLTAKANAFRATGNTDMADYFYDVASAIKDSLNRVDDAVGEAVQQTISRSWESSNSMFRACLAGAAMVTKKKGTRKVLRKLGDAVD